MKQCLIVKSGTTLATGDAYDLTKLAKGQIGFFGLDDSTYVSDAALSKDFGIAVGGGENVRAFVVPEVDFNSLSVAKSGPQEGTRKSVSIYMTYLSVLFDGKPDLALTFIITRKGRKFNERSNWTFTVINPDTGGTGKEFCNQINTNLGQYGYIAKTGSNGTFNITGPINEDFSVQLGTCDYYSRNNTNEGLIRHNKFVPSVNLKADIQELALACAAGKSVNYLAEDGKELYPNFPVEVDSDKYVVYTLRFAVGRAAAKQRDEKVTQTVHIAVPSDSAIVTSLDTLFGVA